MDSRWPRTILHADMDAFYAAIEQLDRPELRGKPIIVGGLSHRSVVSTASYEARRYGVGSAMPMVRARKLCPQAIIVPPRFERYQEVSSQIMEAFGRFSPLVEPLSLDEAFLDMTGTEGLFGDPVTAGRKLKAAVREATGGLTVSVGIAATKFVAKVASDFNKPDGLTVVPPAETLQFLRPLPIRRLWGVGPRSAEALARLRLATIGDVAAASRSWLVAELGSLGAHIHSLARGEDPREVEPGRETQSIGHEDTLEEDIEGAEATKPLLLNAADHVAARLRAEHLLARGVRVKIKTASFHLMTRQRSITPASDSAKPLYEAAVSLLEAFEWHEPLRLVGLAAFNFAAAGEMVQGDLFAAPEQRRQARLDRTVDELRERFGINAVRRASDVAQDTADSATAKPLRRG